MVAAAAAAAARIRRCLHRCGCQADTEHAAKQSLAAAVRTQDFAKHHGRRAGAAENRYYNYEAKEDPGSIASHAVDTEEAISMVCLDLMLSRCVDEEQHQKH